MIDTDYHDPVLEQFHIIFDSLRTLGFSRKRANKIVKKLVNEYFDGLSA